MGRDAGGGDIEEKERSGGELNQANQVRITRKLDNIHGREERSWGAGNKKKVSKREKTRRRRRKGGEGSLQGL